MVGKVIRTRGEKTKVIVEPATNGIFQRTSRFYDEKRRNIV